MTDITQVLTRIHDLDLPALERKGTASAFTEVYPLMLKIVQAGRELEANTDFFSLLPRERQEAVVRQFEIFLSQVGCIKEFDDVVRYSPNPDMLRAEIANEIRTVYAWFFDHVFFQLDAYIAKGLMRKLLAGGGEVVSFIC